MNISLETVQSPQFVHRLTNQFHGIVRALEDSRAQKQPFNIIAPVKLNGQLADLIGRKAGPGNIIGSAVDTIFTVINTFIGKENFQQGNTPSVRPKAVADPCFQSVSDSGPVPLSSHSAGGAGNIIFRRVREDLQLFHKGHFIFYRGNFGILQFKCHLLPPSCGRNEPKAPPEESF